MTLFCGGVFSEAVAYKQDLEAAGTLEPCSLASGFTRQEINGQWESANGTRRKYSPGINWRITGLTAVSAQFCAETLKSLGP